MIKTVRKDSVKLGKKTHAGYLGFLLALFISSLFVGLNYYLDGTIHDPIRLIACTVVLILIIWLLGYIFFGVWRGSKCWSIRLEGLFNSCSHYVDDTNYPNEYNNKKTTIHFTSKNDLDASYVISGHHEILCLHGTPIRILKNEVGGFLVETP